MFWPFSSSCPIDDPSRQWLDKHLVWLAREFEDESPVERKLILPTTECFPDPYDGSIEAVQALFDRVCDYMNVEPDRVRLAVMDASRGPAFINENNDLIPTAAGLYERT